MHLKVFLKLKKTLKSLISYGQIYKKTKKNPKKPKKTQKLKKKKKPQKNEKTHWAGFFFKPWFFPTLPMLGSCPQADELEPRHHGAVTQE
jgi:hypothetical protein